MSRSLIFFLMVIGCTQVCSSHKIVLMVANLKSHVYYFGQLGKSLVSHGHDVTFVLGSKMEVPDYLRDSNIRFEFYNMDQTAFAESVENQHMVISTAFNYSFFTSIQNTRILAMKAINESEQIFNDKAFLNSFEKNNFDFAVVDAPLLAYHILMYKSNIPYAILGPEMHYWVCRVPIMPSYVPHFIGWYSDRMTFRERTLNTLMYVLTTMTALYPKGKDRVEVLAPDKPAIGYQELMATAVLFLRLKIEVFDTARPSMPNIINVGGLMGRPAMELSDELTLFVQDSPDGVIIVSFGSWLEILPEYVISKFIKAFQQIKQRVIWKFKGQILETLPSNVLMLPWIPQNDLLGNSNIQLFITHAGISSCIETVYHGVPIIAFPLGLDQTANSNMAVEKGYGIKMDISKFTPAELVQSIHDVTHGNYKRNIQTASAIFQSLPDAGDTASFWIDHVIRHGAGHLKVYAYELTWYQYLLIDVIGFLAVCLIFVFCACKFVCNWCCRCCKWCRCCRKDKKKKE